EAPPPRPADRPDPLPQGAVARMGTHRFRHPGWPRSLQYGLGGQVLVSVGRGPAVVWDARTGEARRTIGVPRPDEAEVGQTIVEAGRVLADGRSLLLYGNEVVQRHAYTNRGFVWDLERDAEARAFRFGVHKDRRMFGAPGAFAADGSAVAEAEPGFGDDPGTVWLWGEGGKPTGRLAGATTGAGNMWGGDSFALSPDGKLLYVIRPDHSVAVWDVAGEKPVRTFGGGLPVPSAFAVSPDGQHLAIFAAAPREKGRPAPRQPEAVRVWDPAAGKLVTAFEWEKPAADDAWMLHVGFLPDGSVWAAADAGAVFTFRQWDRATGQQVRDWTARLVGRTAQVAVSPDGGRVAVAIHTGLIRVFDAATGRVVSPDNGHQAEVTAVRFTPDGKRLVTVSDDGTARTWDAATGAELRRIDRVGLYPGLSADAGTVFAPDRPKWEAAGRRGLVARDTATGRELWRAEGLFAAFPAPDGRTAVAFERGAAEATLIDLATGRVIRPIPVKGTPLTIGPGGRMAVYAEKNAVSLWDLTTGRRDTGWDAQDAGLLRSATSPGLDRDPDDRIEAAALSPDGKRLAVVVARGSPVQNHEHGCVYVCAATTGEVVWRAKSDFSLGRSAAFSPDGAWVAVAGDRVRVFDAATGGERPGFDGHRGAVQVVAFSPDGTRLATGGADGTAVVWEVPRR
ncbi:MAG: PQQ-binding-like beta-propeller repeat protein, partial [Gemmataceae bacterium]|nr:PQQ-binding-like beta-propeller repeat protein [Gemmataceae bacterium]